jgi:serine-type D-Ala-D-Ala endopeptidase (penicillin-binding protein 7)
MKPFPILFGAALLTIGVISRAEPNRYDDNASIYYPITSKPITLSVEPNLGGDHGDLLDPGLLASSVLVLDRSSGVVLYEKNPDVTQPIASITKLMTAMVVLNSGQPLEQMLTVTSLDARVARPTHSKLRIGARLSRSELLRLMLMASENRAAATLARSFPGGLVAFVRRMNETALALGLFSTQFADPTGLHPGNASTARELATLVQHASRRDLIRAYSTTPEYAVSLRRARATLFQNTNRLTRSADWDIRLSKTGFINASGQCLVLEANVAGHPVVMVILDSWGKGGRVEDAQRLRGWLEKRAEPWVVARM